MAFNYPRWSKLSYTGESSPPANPEEPLAGSWPLILLKRDGKGWFTGPLGDSIPQVQDPNTIDWDSELKVVQKTLIYLTPEQQILADYWGSGPPTKQFTPIIDRLIDTYTISQSSSLVSMSPPRAAHILALTQAAISDAFIVGWTVKYRYDVARPNQLDHKLATYLCTPRHPSYISGHSIVAGVVTEVLSYFFPTEKGRLELAEECAASRLYAGVHYPIDNSKGLRIGRAIGKSLVTYFATQVNSAGKPINQPFTDDRQPILPPGCYPYEQAMPFHFVKLCQSTVLEVPIIDKIKKFFLKLFGCQKK